MVMHAQEQTTVKLASQVHCLGQFMFCSFASSRYHDLKGDDDWHQLQHFNKYIYIYAYIHIYSCYELHYRRRAQLPAVFCIALP